MDIFRETKLERNSKPIYYQDIYQKRLVGQVVQINKRFKYIV